jgi:1-acyl-sn-glycerol-3-phosphate acyltransferase
VVYRLVTRLLAPLAFWGRMRVSGADAVPEQGAVLVVANHDSQFDPVMVGVALRKRRPLQFLAHAGLFRIRGLGPVLRAMNQIPIERGAGDAGALQSATDALAKGQAVCIFPEGKLSLGQRLRARSGVGRLLAEAPGTVVVLAAVTGTTDYARFPRRPRVGVAFSRAPAGALDGAGDPATVAERLLAEVRRDAPPVAAGRDGEGGRAARKARAKAEAAS